MMDGFGKLLDERERIIYEGFFDKNEFTSMGILYNYTDGEVRKAGEVLEKLSGKDGECNIEFEVMFGEMIKKYVGSFS